METDQKAVQTMDLTFHVVCAALVYFKVGKFLFIRITAGRLLLPSLQE